MSRIASIVARLRQALRFRQLPRGDTAVADRRNQADEIGQWGEAIAERELREKGYRILGRRVRLDPRNEIDIVARDGQVLVFVEVKARKTEEFGRAVSAVDRKKRHVLSRAAVRYLRKLKSPRVCFRFDVVEVIGEPGDLRDVRHIANAFPLDRRYSLPA
jgi:putative endonuclease